MALVNEPTRKMHYQLRNGLHNICSFGKILKVYKLISEKLFFISFMGFPYDVIFYLFIK